MAIPPDHRAAVMSAFYIVAYTAISVPAIIAGVGGGDARVCETTFEIFGSVIAVLALVVAFEAWRTRPAVRAARSPEVPYPSAHDANIRSC